jgi:hypothetical protein
LRLFSPENYELAASADLLAVDIRGGEPIVAADLVLPGGRRVRGAFKLDTGSMDVAGMALNFVRDNDVVAADTRELTLQGIAVGGSTEGRLLRAEAFELGRDRLERPIVGYVVDSGGFENRAYAGTIGGKMIARRRLVLDYPHARIAFFGEPRTREPEDRSGLFLVAAPPDFRHLTAAMIAPGSPADEAGIRPGDEIMSFDGRELSLVAARARLERAGPLELRFRQEGTERTVHVVCRPLLP